MCEQTPVKQLVSNLADAEAAGFNFSVMSDHYSPWLEEQGHSGYAWSVLGAAARATHRLPLRELGDLPYADALKSYEGDLAPGAHYDGCLFRGTVFTANQD